MTALLVDLDRRRVSAAWGVALWDTLRRVGLTVQGVRWDRTRRGWHVLVWVRERLDLGTQVAVQLLLGSDRARETFNAFRAVRIRHAPPLWRRRANVLYAEKL